MNKKYSLIVLLLIIFVFIIIYFINNKKDQIVNEFEIYFFNAGKADAILITNDDKHILIDTATQEYSNKLISYLKKNKIEKIDYLIITHFDKDHVGGASSIINNFKIDNVLQSNYPKDSIYYTNYINSISENNITPLTVINNDYSFELNDLNVIVNGPNKIYDKNESNNSSLIVSVKYKNTSYLFTGDIENARIKDYLSKNTDEYDMIKIPYHGNYQKRLDDLLNKTNPKYAVITSNITKDIASTIDLLDSMKIKYYVTGNGDVKVYSDGEKIFIKQ